MPPVNTSASPTDVDNEATAELPVLDVAAYESTLNDPVAHTDTWVLPADTLTTVSTTVDATAQMPAISPPPKPAYDIDHSGTHEMPQMPLMVPKSGRKAAKSAAVLAPAPMPPSASTPVSAAVPITVPPSPPLIEELRTALATAERRIEELNERARIADAERGVAVARANAEAAQLREQLAAHLESLHTAKERLAVQSADTPELEDQLFARADRIAALEKTLAEKSARLTKSEERCEVLDCEDMNLRATVTRRNAQIATLEADLVARQQRESQLRDRLAEALASTDPYVPELRAELHARDEQIRLLKLDVDIARSHAAEKDHDLQVAEEYIRNLEIDVRDKNSKLEEANVTVEEWRAVIAESQRSILQRDGQIQQLQTDLEKRIAVSTDSAAQTGEEVLLEGPARVLIRTDGNTDFVHVLGRRTRIGRGSDNELVLDTKHISRYHAVLLAGPVHTSIEDLNSTNGVFVNGKRVSRQILKDGDRVTVGRTQFRYSVRD
jgi:hypothetical protein